MVIKGPSCQSNLPQDKQLSTGAMIQAIRIEVLRATVDKLLPAAMICHSMVQVYPASKAVALQHAEEANNSANVQSSLHQRLFRKLRDHPSGRFLMPVDLAQ